MRERKENILRCFFVHILHSFYDTDKNKIYFTKNYVQTKDKERKKNVRSFRDK